jgi:hypothetical protein
MFNILKIDDITFDGIDHSDCPDYCDAYISGAFWKNGVALTEDELDQLNSQHRDFVYEKLIEYLY